MAAGATIYKSSSFPHTPGNELECMVNIKGPTSYTAITNGSPPTGGQNVNALDMGLTYISRGFIMTSDDGQYTGDIVFPLQTAGVNPVGTSPSVLIRWIVAATGAEVAGATNLSGRSLRALFYGSY